MKVQVNGTTIVMSSDLSLTQVLDKVKRLYGYKAVSFRFENNVLIIEEA